MTHLPILRPLHTGLTLAITVALFYALCTVAWIVAPGPFMGFMNNLFHGMDFSPMVQAKPFDVSGFIGALLLLSIWAGFVGAFFAWLYNRLTK